ncbi:MAG: MFS transporter [Clostridia bacterium]|nr:MFS transporter [Clostridia bacterium]
MVNKIKSILSDARIYWNLPMPGRYMTFKEIAAYSGGGIGAYMIITLGTACLLATNNTLLSSTLGIDPTDMYIMYVIAVLANIPLTGIRANIIDNTRNKAGKYRPYIVSMAIPTAIICILMVWFPYDAFGSLFGDAVVFGESISYIVKCALVLILNLLLHFFYYFFYDGYENLIHVLSPNSQERTDVSSIKSVVYSFAPTVVNLLTPLIAQHIFKTNTTDIRVYRFLYPILGVLGILLCIVVYKYTEEKIVQARTHIVSIKFWDSLKAVAKNKYFWIISLASWIGFLEIAYANILFWLYNYGGACSGNQYGLIVTIYGNASLWGMLLAPFCIRKWGKKAVLVVTNIFNIVFILMMLPFTSEINNLTIWLVMACLYLNAFMGSFAHILNPAIQADIRDYQQYKTGERIDGMFSAISTIGTVIALITSSVLPIVYENGGITKDNAAIVTKNPDVLNRLLGDGKTVGQILAEQLANGQDNYNNAYSALYDPDILLSLIKVLIIVAACGALMNVIPFFWYDFNERKQKSVVRVLKVRALFEDYGNGITNDNDLVEGIDIIRHAREMAVAAPKAVDKKSYKSVKGKAERKAAKKAYKADLEFNEEIEISKFVCDELDKFSSPVVQYQIAESRKICSAGLNHLLQVDMDELKAELKHARSMPKATAEEKEMRKFAIELAKKKISSCKSIKKYFKDTTELIQPDFQILDEYFDKEDEIDAEIKALYLDLKKEKNKEKTLEMKAKIKALKKDKEAIQDKAKAEMDKHAYFNRAAKPYLDADKLIKQQENYTHFEDIAAQYEEAKMRSEAERAAKIEEQKRLEAEKQAQKEEKLKEKEAAKMAKKNK